MMLARVKASKLLQFEPEQLWDHLIGEFDLVFDDGTVIRTNYRETIYSAYYWLYQKHFGSPLSARHHVRSHYNGENMDKNTHAKVCAICMWEAIDYTGSNTPDARQPFLKLAYAATNRLYNDFIERARPWVVTVDILDFIELMEHDVLSPIISSPVATREYIDSTYAALATVYKDPRMSRNNIVRGIAEGTVKKDQANQCIGSRGALTHVDGVVINTPITGSFAGGLKTMYNVVVESLSAQKALYFAESPLEDAEYFARRLRIQACPVERVHYGDCGSQEYVLFRVKESDLPHIVGMYYYDDNEQVLKDVKVDDLHLVGTTIKMRNVIFCHHHDKHTVCSTCFGKMADNVTNVMNVGHASSAAVTHETGQSILSTKHLIVSATGQIIQLSDHARTYLKGLGDLSIGVKPGIKQKNKMVLSASECFGLTDIKMTQYVEDINPSRICSIQVVGFINNNNGIVFTDAVTITTDKPAALSVDFMRFLKVHGWELDRHGNFVIDLTYWDDHKPIFVLPEAEYSYSQHSSEIANIIESKMNKITDRLQPTSCAATLVELYDLVNSKLKCHISLLSVIVYAVMVKDGANGNYDLARNSPYKSMGVAKLTTRYRSLSGAYAYNYQAETIRNPDSFFVENRPDTPLDAMIDPYNVIQHYGLRW